MQGSLVLLIMDQNIHNIFKDVAEISPEAGLTSRIFRAVEVEKDRAIKRKLIISRFGLGISAAVFLTAIFTFGTAILQSEFWSISSLFFSDMQTVLLDWQDFTYSLLENFPTVSVIAILAPIMMLLVSFSVYLEANNKHKYI